MPRDWIGPAWILFFALSQAVRDVYFAGVFRDVSPFAVVLLAFGLSTAVSLGIALARAPGEIAIVWREPGTLVGMNVATAIAWNCYFHGLAQLQPSIVNTLHSGIGPLTVLVLAAAGSPLARHGRVARLEATCHGGLLVSLAWLWWVVLSGRSGLARDAAPDASTLVALALLVVSGACITISLLLARRLAELGAGANAVNGMRYPLIVIVTAILFALEDRPSGLTSAGHVAGIAFAAALLIALPVYFLQLGIGRTAPLTAHVLRTLGPVCVFALELVDDRIRYAPPVLAGIVAYSVFAIGATLAHARART